MSGNQKQAATGGPQTQRYSVAPSPYQPITQPPARADGFHVSTTPSYVSQQGNQAGNQGPTLRGIAPTGPPNQASTPPNTDIKLPTVPPSSSLGGHLFVPSSVRGAQPSFYRPAAVSATSQAARMPNRQGQQQIYQQTPYVQLPVQLPVHFTSNPVPFYSHSQRQQQFVPQVPVYQSNVPYTGYPPAQPQPSSIGYYTTYGMNLRPGPPSQNNAAPQNTAQPTIPNMSMPPPAPPQSTYTTQRRHNTRRPNALAIIDPDTGIDRLTELLDQENSHPASGESSTSQTPQPAPGKEVAATFAKQVAQVLNNDVAHEEMEHHSIPQEHIEQPVYNAPQAAHNPSRLESIVQSSTLKVQAKEFVLPPAAKEPPVVSANCDAVEVTLPNKQPKDRESPVKARKPSAREHKDSVKEPSLIGGGNFNNNNLPEKQAAVVKEERQKETPPVTVSKVEKDNPPVSHREEKKSKKEVDVADSSKVPNVEVNDVSTALNTPPAQPAQENKANAKSRNSSRTKENHKQMPPHGMPKQTVAVPPPQPAKPSSKSSKKSELNQKGASKEGTDMDVFSDTVNIDSVNANVVNNSINNDIVNANNLANNNNNDNAPNNVSSAPAPPAVASKEAKKTATESNEMQTIKPPEPKITLTRNNYDITSIVKDNYNPTKHFVPPQPVAPIVQQEEQERPSMLNGDKLARGKNEANDASGVRTERVLYTMKDGVKRYEPDVLLRLRDSPLSNQKPEGILDIVALDDRGRLCERISMGGRDFVNPPFAYGGKSGSQRGVPPKRNSQSGKLGGGGGKGSKSSTTTMPKLSISLRDEVKLHHTENAWKPLRLLGSVDKSEEEKKTEELFRKVRGVLNKLTPEKFATLVGQVQALEIDTESRLQGVIDLVFEKAVDEPNFSVAYALMCKELALMQVPTANSTEEKKEYVNFRKLLVTRCQKEFEKNTVDESKRNAMLAEIQQCQDPEKKKQLQEDLEEYDRRLRMKSVGNIRFIGELFKQSMLTVNIMYKCLTTLLEDKNEESLECLCKLLATVGKEFEAKSGKLDLSGIFNTMKEIVDKKHVKVSSRVRFMLQDVLDLKKNKWVPRRQDMNPKTIDQIQKEHENEQLSIQAMNSMPSTSRKDDRGGGGGGGGGGPGPGGDRKQRRNISEDGWTTRTSSRNQITVMSDKLKVKIPQKEERFGSNQMFGIWCKGSGMNNSQNNSQTNLPASVNMYAALENMDTEKKPGGGVGPSDRSSSRDPYSSKGSSMERPFKQPYDGRGSRSGSQHRSGESSGLSSQRSTPGPMAPPPRQPPQQPLPPPPVQLPPPEPTIRLTPEQIERRVRNNLEEYVGDSCSMEEYERDTRAIVPPSEYPRLVADSYLNILDRSSYARLKTSKLFAYLIKQGTLALDDYCAGLEEVLSQTEDLAIDIPKIWEYVPEILVHVICEEALPLARLQRCFGDLVTQSHAAKILIALFRKVLSERGPNFLQNIWQASGLTLNDFMPASEVENFLRQGDFGFLAGGRAPVGVTQLSYEQIGEKLKEFLESGVSFDEIANWITANVGEKVKENKFIRVLATAIFEDSISDSKLNSERLLDHSKLLHKYVDNTPSYELQCLYALQALINKLEHPKGLLLSICNQLYEDGTFSQESFIAWEKSTDPAEQEGKGVAIKQLVSFFTQLQENDEDESTGEDET